MRDWSLQAGDPLSLVISADARLSTPDYLNDQSWEVSLAGGDPPALAVRTTYGLRARNMRLFHRFSEAGKAVTDPADFHRAPSVRRFYPNFLAIDLAPLEGLEATTELWVPESHVLAGRLILVNRTTFPRRVEFELCGLLNPMDGKAFGPVRQQQMVRVLSGATGGLHPVVFMSGGPDQGIGPQTALRVGLDFEGGTQRVVTWACAAESSEAESFELARRTAGRNWEAERARIELLNASDTIEIHTGDADWDAALALGQSAALRCFLPGGRNLPKHSFVRVRGPDHGFSRTLDGSDYSPAWKGQSPFDSYYISGLLPGALGTRRDLLENYISVQSEDGGIDAWPGLGGQRSHFLAAPLLATMAWDHYQRSQDRDFLAEVFPKLLAFCHAWFAPGRDPDGDGVPEWEHVLQTGFEENPLFDVWYPWSQALNVQMLFNPELEALLYREVTALIGMANALDLREEAQDLEMRLPRLAASISAAWDEQAGRYGYRDRQTAASSGARLIGSRTGPGEIRPRRPECDQPVRLLVQVHTKSAAATRPVVEIVGRSQVPMRRLRRRDKASEDTQKKPGKHTQSELMDAARFQWRSGGLVAVSALVYGAVERVVVRDLDEKDRVLVRTVDSDGEDITLFTPLWARMPHPDRAAAMVQGLMQDEKRFNRPFGIPALSSAPSAPRAGMNERAEADTLAMSVHLPWNSLIGEGLLAYGYRDEAARLTIRLMNAVVRSLKENATFYERYHAVTGAGIGERGSLSGITPVGLFLRTLGVEFLSATRVQLEGVNPFPWPVTLAYRGVRVLRGLDSTEVKFPNKPAITVTGADSCVVSIPETTGSARLL